MTNDWRVRLCCGDPQHCSNSVGSDRLLFLVAARVASMDNLITCDLMKKETIMISYFFVFAVPWKSGYAFVTG